MKYHINPETGVPNRCGAKKSDGCPFKNSDGTPSVHYETKQEAYDAYENEQKTNTLPSLSKTKKQKFNNAFLDDEDSFINEIIKPDNLHYFLEAETYYPGCSGCEEPYDDYCRCVTYSGYVTKNADSEAEFFYKKIFDDPRIFYTTIHGDWYYKDSNDPRGKVKVPNNVTDSIEKIKKYLKDNSVFDVDSVTVNSLGGYYGEEFDSYSFDNEKEKLKLKSFISDLKKDYNI